ncbi:hypothetical protein [Chlamydia caviae]|uniref:Uncharacterized protein n=1 Tax=Chlamydia caviae (strain ATCC VR-813 / DSM 19441 / 03DC25 / GPIC) TaxID=227941 RepID=Q822N6_CHLCV|nr:hypothetical protein [Chlamydia caviae]AAP05387.1 hypothetical protein CCA_00645 [Chlamydia caviae GPIC]
MTKPTSQEITTINPVQTSFPLFCRQSISSSALGVCISVSAILATAAVIACLCLARSSEILIIIMALITGVLVILCFLQIVFHIHGKKQRAIQHPSPLQPQPLAPTQTLVLPQLPEATLTELQQKMSTDPKPQ